MEYAYRYGDPRRLYLNVTNRCTNSCNFCIRCHVRGLSGADLWGGPEPDLSLLRDAVQKYGGPEDFDEFVWCGFGEPTYRLDLILEASAWLRRGGARIRLNTNGHACLIHGCDVLPELAGAVDSASVSLNAPDCARYLELCLPDPDSVLTEQIPDPSDFWTAMLDFLARSPDHFSRVQASVVGSALTPLEIARCRMLASTLRVNQFRVR